MSPPSPSSLPVVPAPTAAIDAHAPPSSGLSALMRKPSLVDGVRDLLRGKIESGAWAASSQVPTEKTLAEQLAVSRATVREALSRLKQEGYLHSVQGKGAFVAAQPGLGMFRLEPAIAEAEADEAQIFELRALVEQDCAALAAARRTQADLRAMRRALKAMQQEQAAGGLGMAADIAFHRAIGVASGNPILARFAEFIGRHSREYLQVTRLSALKAENRLQEVAAEHERIVVAIEARDAAAAREAVKRHLDNGARRVRLGVPL